MKMVIVILLSFVTTLAHAFVVPKFQDIKPATQQMIEKQVITNPALGTAVVLKALTATSSSVTTTFTTFLAQPDVPRNVVITTGGTTADCKLATVVVNGTNFYDRTISENFAISDNQAGATTGAKAFKSVTSVVIPAQDGSGCTYSVGTGTKLGLKSCMATADHYFHTGFGGVKEATAATVAANASAVESNTISLNSALDGAHTVNAFYMQNFACHK